MVHETLCERYWCESSCRVTVILVSLFTVLIPRMQLHCKHLSCVDKQSLAARHFKGIRKTSHASDGKSSRHGEGR